MEGDFCQFLAYLYLDHEVVYERPTAETLEDDEELSPALSIAHPELTPDDDFTRL